MVETTDEINLVKEIERLESMYLHYKRLYRRETSKAYYSCQYLISFDIFS